MMKKTAIILLLLTTTLNAHAQVAVKNNLAYDASLTPNISIETVLKNRWTADLTYALNPWRLGDGKQLRHWLLQPELRRYFCQPTNGSYLAAHLLGGQFNAGGVRLPLGLVPTLRNNRYEGWFAGAGIGLGYQWPLSTRFSIDLEVAVGYAYLSYKKYPCADCGSLLDEGHHHYVGPTKLAVSMVYNIGPTKSARTAEAMMPIVPIEAPAADVETTTPVLSGRASVESPLLTADGRLLLLTMHVRLDSLRLRHRQAVALRPVLRSADGLQAVRFRPLLITSHEQHLMYRLGAYSQQYPDAIETERQAGRQQTVSYAAQVPAESWMSRYTLEIEEDRCGCGDVVADATTALLTHDPQPTLPPAIHIALTADEYKKVRRLEGRAYIDFRLDRTDLDPNYRRNPEELGKITATIDSVAGKPDVEINMVTIHGYASPEGSYEHNAWLAQQRAATLSAYIRRLYRFPEGAVGSTSTAEDWEGLRRYVDSHATDDRQQLLAIIDNTMDYDQKELMLRQQHPERYQQLLSEVYPALRHSDYVVSYTIRLYTLEESRTVYRQHPERLSLPELTALAAEAGIDAPEGRAILYHAAALLPRNDRAQLVAAQAALRAADYDKAEALITPLSNRRGGGGEAFYLLGSLRKMQRRYDEALSLMQQALESGISEAAAQIDELKQLNHH